MAYEHEGPLPPPNPQDWWLWLKTPQLQEMLFLPHGEWILHRDLANGPGVTLAEGGVVAGRIDGAHGHMPLWMADVLESLKVDGAPVVTENRVAQMVKELVKRFTPKAPVVVDGKLGRSLEGRFVVEHSTVLLKTDNQPITLPDEMLPSFSDGTKPTWDHCMVLMVPMLGQPAFSIRSARFLRVSASHLFSMMANRNCGDPDDGNHVGLWVHRVPGDGAPVYKVFYQDKSGTIPSVACNCTIWGFR